MVAQSDCPHIDDSGDAAGYICMYLRKKNIVIFIVGTTSPEIR